MSTKTSTKRRSPFQRLVFRFFAKVRLGEFAQTHGKMHSACWIWTGAISKSGYGHMKIRGRMVSAHVLSFAMMRSAPVHKDLLPTTCTLHHRCGVPLCVNPEHIQFLAHKRHCQIHWRGTAARDKLGRFCRMAGEPQSSFGKRYRKQCDLRMAHAAEAADEQTNPLRLCKILQSLFTFTDGESAT